MLWEGVSQFTKQQACLGCDVKLSQSNIGYLSSSYLCMSCAVMQETRRCCFAVTLQGNTPHNCCQIFAKLNNSIMAVEGWLPFFFFVCNNQICVEARRVVLSETLSVAVQPGDCFHRKQFCWLNEVWLWSGDLKNIDCLYNCLFLVKSVI